MRYPTPSTSRLSNGDTMNTPLSRYAAKNDASTSSRLNPHVVWVRSLVPYEKNSATVAIRFDVSAARGSSIIVPIGAVNGTPYSSATRWRMPSASSRTRCSSMTDPTSGTMISTCGAPPASRRSAAASAIARTCIANSPGTTRPRRTPRSPSIGLDSCNRSTAASSASSCGSTASRSRATATLTASSVRSVRNSCSGGSSSRIVTGSPSMAVRISTKSARCSGSSSARAASRCSGVAARITRSMSGRRSPRNMCSVRHRPIPSAPMCRAAAASAAVSALARTRSRRTASACRMTRSTLRRVSLVSESASASAASRLSVR